VTFVRRPLKKKTSVPSFLVLVACLALCIVAGCGPAVRIAVEPVDIEVKLTPKELPGGAATLATLTLRDPARRPVRGAHLQITGFMSHPGMAPLIVTVEEQGNGIYEAYLRFTMVGDWSLLVTGQLPDGRMISSSLKCQVSSFESQFVSGVCT
jgi:YtkA-like protein